MNTLEPMILLVWIVGIIVIQFHKPTMSFISKYDYLGFFPGFFLFSPRPLNGFFKIKYEVTYVKDYFTKVSHSEVVYILPRDLIDTNQKIIKCINALCRSSISKPVMNNNHFNLLINYILNDAKRKSFSGKLHFDIILVTNTSEFVKFNSRYYDL